MMAQDKKNRFVGLLPAFALSSLHATWAAANPEGGAVVAGDVTITGGAERLDVSQRGEKAIIDWQRFDVEAGEATHFHQPSASSVTLNRVVAGGASRLDGLVTAPGKVFLVNPAGVTFGPNAEVAVHSLVATTADLANEDFLAGRYDFSRAAPGAAAAIVNLGRIEAAPGGSVVLAAPEVRNEGLVIASLGTVELAGADRFVLDFTGDGLLSFDVGEAAPGADGRIVQQGRIAADGGLVVLRTRDADALIDRTINMTGVIEARSVGEHEGAIVLSGGTGTVGIEGTLDVSGDAAGESAGRVEISGARVGLFDGARIVANAPAGGGTVDVGTRAPELDSTAGTRRTYFDAGAEIAADATSGGDGGRVIVWGEEITRFHGAISARGAGAGNGGFVEVSARDSLTFDGTADVGAGSAGGAAGSILLDPFDILICEPPDCSQTTPGNVFAGQPPDTYTVSRASLASLTGNVTLQATNEIKLQLRPSLEMSPGSSLTLQAGGDLIIELLTVPFPPGDDVAPPPPYFISTVGGSLRLEADSPALGADGIGSLSVSRGNVPFEDVQLFSNGGDITLVTSAVDVPGVPVFSLFGLVVNAGAGDILVATSLPDQQFNMDNLQGLEGLSTQGTLTVSAGSFVDSEIGITSAAAMTVLSATGNVELIDDTQVMNGGSLSVRGQTVLLADVDTGGGDFAVTADSFDADAVNVGAGSVSLRAGSVAYGSLSGQGTLTLEPLLPTAPIAVGAVASPPPGAFIVDATLLSDQVGFSEVVVGRLDGAHSIEIADVNLVLPRVVIRSPVGGAIDVTGDAVSGPSLSLTAPTVAVSTGSLTVRGNLDVSATQDVIAAGQIDVLGGTSSFTAGRTIALTNPSNVFGQALSLSTTAGDIQVVSAGQVTLGASSLGSGQTLLTLGDVLVTGPVTGTGGLVLRPIGAGQTVGIGDANVNAAFSLSSAELAALSGDFAVTVGGPDQIGAVLVTDVQVAVPLTLEVQPTAGSISLQGQLVGVDDGAFTFSGPVSLGADITTAAGPISFAGPVTLTQDVRLDAGNSAASAANIVFAGPLAGVANTLTTLTLGNGFMSNESAAPLTLDGLVIEGPAGGANVFGSVGGFTGREAAARVVVLRALDGSYRINGCAMGVGCEAVLNTTALSVPTVPPGAETVERATLNLFSVWERVGTSTDPRDSSYSNLGNEQLWPTVPQEEEPE